MPAKLVQRRRGTTANHSVFAGAEGEITQDTTKNTLVCHDGNTQGGHPLAKEDMSNVSGTASGGGVGIIQLNLSDGANGQVLTTDGSGNMSFQSIDVNSDLALGGDLSGSISNAQIITNAVGINELNVTAPSSGGQLLSADGSGNLQFITPASNMTLSGDISGPLENAQIVAQAVGTPELAANAVTTIKIADLNVTSAKIADGSITSNKIAGLSITTDKITDGNITLAKMADNSIRTGNIIDASVTTPKLAPLSVDGTKIANNTIDGTKIANNAVGITQLSVQSDGNAGEFLQTNGAGILSFATAASTLTGVSGFQGITVINPLRLRGQGDFQFADNIEQTYTPSAGVKKILYFLTAAGDTARNAFGGGTGGRGDGATVMGFLDLEANSITSLNCRVGTGGVGNGSVRNLPSFDRGFSTYLGDLVNGEGAGPDVNSLGTTNDPTSRGSIATAVCGSVTGLPFGSSGGSLILPGGKSGNLNPTQFNSFWPGFGLAQEQAAPFTFQCSSGGGTQSEDRPGGVGDPGIIVILEFA